MWKPESSALTHKLYQLHDTRSPIFLFLNAFFSLEHPDTFREMFFPSLYVYAICNDLPFMVKTFDPDVEEVLTWALSSLWEGQEAHPQAGCLLLFPLLCLQHVCQRVIRCMQSTLESPLPRSQALALTPLYQLYVFLPQLHVISWPWQVRD